MWWRRRRTVCFRPCVFGWRKNWQVRGDDNYDWHSSEVPWSLQPVWRGIFHFHHGSIFQRSSTSDPWWRTTWSPPYVEPTSINDKLYRILVVDFQWRKSSIGEWNIILRCQGSLHVEEELSSDRSFSDGKNLLRAKRCLVYRYPAGSNSSVMCKLNF